jgi:hypothetical protein
MRPRKKATRWHEHEWIAERALALARLCGVRGLKLGSGATPLPAWARVVADFAPSRKKGGNAALVRAAKRLAGSLEEQAALDATARIGDRGAIRAYLGKLAKPVGPTLTDEQRAVRKASKREALIVKRARHARTKLREAERKLATAKRLIDKWGAKVRYYEGRGVLADAIS